MTDIDWSKAPEGATHYGAESDSYCEAWYRVESGKIVQYAEADNAMAVLKPAREAECYYHCIDDLIALWTGEGLPPVGTVCEAWHNGCAQGVVQVRYSGGCMVLWNVKLKHEQCSASENYTFKPIRTPEQIAAEAREKAVAEMLALDPYLPTAPMGMMSRADFCRALYDAGYRKQAQP